MYRPSSSWDGTYHPQTAVIYALITGPIATPKYDMAMYGSVIHMSSLVSNISCILPLMTALGTADKNPVMRRPMAPAAGNSAAEINTQKMLYKAVLPTYSFFRP